MGQELHDQRQSENAAARPVVSQPVDPLAIEKFCADLCSKLGEPVPEGTAVVKVFGVLPACGKIISHMSFHFGHGNRDLSTAPLPFPIDRNQEVMLLVDYDEKAVRTNYEGAVTLFKDLWKSNRTSILIAAVNNEWAIAVNESGGVSYWQNKSGSALDALSMPTTPE